MSGVFKHIAEANQSLMDKRHYLTNNTYTLEDISNQYLITNQLFSVTILRMNLQAVARFAKLMKSK